MVGIIELASYIIVDLNIPDITSLYPKTIGIIHVSVLISKELSFKRHFKHVLNLDFK